LEALKYLPGQSNSLLKNDRRARESGGQELDVPCIQDLLDSRFRGNDELKATFVFFNSLLARRRFRVEALEVRARPRLYSGTLRNFVAAVNRFGRA